MALNYTFSVTQLEIAPSGSDGHPDVVTRVCYNYVGVDENGYSGSFAGATPMPQPSGSFIPFEDLTETEVVAWLDVVADKPHMQQQIQIYPEPLSQAEGGCQGQRHSRNR